jgi:hypothetical protein
MRPHLLLGLALCNVAMLLSQRYSYAWSVQLADHAAASAAPNSTAAAALVSTIN